MRGLGVALLALVAGSTASANVWQRAVERGEPDLQRNRYDDNMRIGDEWLDQASATDLAAGNLERMVTMALEAYRQAAEARPDAAEPWFRIADVLYGFYVFDSEQKGGLGFRARSPIALHQFDSVHARALVVAWNEAEQRAPLDPRFSLMPGEIDNGILFERAILETKLIDSASQNEATRLLQAAETDYEKILARADSSFIGSEQHETVAGNLAETYMMLGRLDPAIEMYRTAVKIGTSASTMYGLAVALDRADQPEEALAMIREHGQAEAKGFFDSVAQGKTFFVPAGEANYYSALIEEAFGEEDNAIGFWREFIQSGAHPEFQPRAKDHIDALLGHKHVRVPPPPFDEPMGR